jgi:outer membrane protein assembly factor BamB
VANYVVFGSSDGLVQALNEWNGTLLWSFAAGGPVTSSPLVVGDLVFVGSEDGRLYCLNLATGTPPWPQPRSLGGPVSSSPAYDPASEVIVVGTHYDDGKGRVYGLRLDSGTEVWNFTAPAPVASTPAILGGTAYVGCDDGSVYAFSAANGNLLWAANLSKYASGDDARVRSSPAVSAECLCVGVGYNTFVALRPQDGGYLWDRDLGSPQADRYLLSSSALSYSRIFVGADRIYALNARTGAEIWSFDAGAWVWASPAIARESPGSGKGVVFCAGGSGRLVAFSSSTDLSPLAVISSPIDGSSYRVGENVFFNEIGRAHV